MNPIPVDEGSSRTFAGQFRLHRFEFAAALVILIWRAAVVPLATAWRDWVIVLSLYWIWSIFSETRRSWGVVTVSTMAFLLGIYATGQLPHTLGMLALAP